MTANTTAKSVTDDLSARARARAERILSLVADHGEQILTNTPDPLDIPDYLLPTLVQAGDALVRLAELDTKQPAPAPTEILLDGDGDLWVRIEADRDMFECVSSHDAEQPLDQIRAKRGIRKEFVAAPPGR